VVVVVAGGFEVERGEQRECQRLEKMFGEFGAEIAHFVPFEFSVEFDPRAAG
jgi:hypothetical protein